MHGHFRDSFGPELTLFLLASWAFWRLADQDHPVLEGKFLTGFLNIEWPGDQVPVFQETRWTEPGIPTRGEILESGPSSGLSAQMKV